MHKQGPLDLWSLARARTGSNAAKVRNIFGTRKKSLFYFRDIPLSLQIKIVSLHPVRDGRCQSTWRLQYLNKMSKRENID